MLQIHVLRSIKYYPVKEFLPRKKNNHFETVFMFYYFPLKTIELSKVYTIQ